MAMLSSQLHMELREALLQCGPFDTDEALRSLFVDARLEPWRHQVPQAGSEDKRVDALIELLYDQYHAYEKRNALVLFVEAAADRIDPDDACNEHLRSLAKRLESQLVPGGGAASSKMLVYYEQPPVAGSPHTLFGRESLVRRLGPLILDTPQHVLLYGLAGSGKTALASTVAEAYMGAKRGPVAWLETGHDDADTIFDALAEHLGSDEEKRAIRQATGDNDIEAARQMLEQHRGMLLVLDNVWDGAALYQVLQAVPDNMPFMATSRIIFGSGFDEVVAVEDLAPSAAIQLLSAHAGKDLAGDTAAEALCRQLGYHAYALEIAGTILKGGQRTAARLLRRLERRPYSVSVPGRPALYTLLDESVQELNAEVRDVFLAIGGLLVPETTPALLATYMERDPVEVWEALDDLLEHSLARAGRTGEGESELSDVDFYTFHDLTFSYAQALQESGEAGTKAIVAAVQRYAEAFAHDFTHLALDQGNILAAAKVAQAENPPAMVAIITRLALDGYVDTHGFSRELLRLLDATVELVRQQPGEGELLHYLLGKQGNARFDRGELDKALASYLAALELATEVMGDTTRQVVLSAVIGRVYAKQKSDEEADDYFGRAYERVQADGDGGALRFVLEQHSLAASYRGDYAKVQELAEKGIEISVQTGDRIREAYFKLNLGSAALDLAGHADTALERHQEVLAIAEAENSNVLKAYALFALARDYHALAERPRAARCLDRAYTLFRDLGNIEYMMSVRRFGEKHAFQLGGAANET